MASMSCRIYTLAVLFIHILMTSAWSHKEYEMSSDQVCSRMGRRELPITFDHPALVRDGGRLFSDWPGIRRYDCRWKVEGKRDGKGVTAVAQKVRLRKASEKDCVDYIQFKRESRVDKGPRVCGSVLFGVLLDQNDTFPSPAPYSDSLSDAVDPKNDWVSLAAYGAIIDVEGEVMTYVHVAQRKLQQGEKIEMVVAYTAFQECREKVPEGSFHCGYGLCISSTLVKDGVINCPFADCIDEGSCHEARNSNVTRQILTKTMIERVGGSDHTSSSFAALFILVVICLAIYYLYRRYRKNRRLPVDAYSTVNGTAQQQTLTGTGYIEIPGSASNLPYDSDPTILIPYSLDPNQLQAVPIGAASYMVLPPSPPQPTAPPYPPAIPTQQPNPPSSPNMARGGVSPPPIGFVVAEVSVPPPGPPSLPPTPPITRGTPPITRGTPPPVPRGTPPPVVRGTPPPVVRGTPPPVVRGTPPPVVRGTPPPVTKGTPPVTMETQPVAVETQPVAVETQPVSGETPPVAGETPPVAAQTPPIVRETPQQTPPPPPPRPPPRTEPSAPPAEP